MNVYSSWAWKVTAFAVLMLLGGCAAERLHREGMSLIAGGDVQKGVSKLDEAQQTDPANAQYRKDWLLQRDRLILKELAEGYKERSAGNWDLALEHYRRVLSIDPGNSQGRQAVAMVPQERRQAAMIDDASALFARGDSGAAKELVTRVLIENPNHTAALQLRRKILDAAPPESMDGNRLNIKNGKPVTLQFREANLRQVMEAISRTTSLNVIFDKDVKSDAKVTIFVRDTPVEEAVDLILMQTRNAKRVLSENSILVYPDTDTKTKDYADLKIRRFALTNADPKQVQSMIKTMLKTKDMYVDEKGTAVVVRDTPQVIRMVEKLIYAMDQPDPEVMLDIDVMEVTRERMLALGIDLPTTFGASTSGLTLQQFRNLTDANINVTDVSVGLKAQKIDNDINDLATPRIRVRNREKAKFLVGDRLPVISTAAVPTSTLTTPVYNTSVQYVDVGIKIEVEPTIYDDGEVAIRLLLEVSSNSGQNADAAKNGTIAYTISTRSVNTVLRLKDGQTEIIGGLIQNQDDSSATRIPGLGDVPVLGRLFGSQTDKRNKKEIILSITPHLVRSNRQADNSVLEMWAGTETNFRFGSRPPVAAAPAAAASTVSTLPTATSAPAVAAAGAAPTTGSRVQPVAGGVGAAGAALPAAAATPPKPNEAPPLKPFTLIGPSSTKVGTRFDVNVAQPVYASSQNAEVVINYDADHLRLVSVLEADPARNAASGAKFSSDIDSGGVVRLSLTAAPGQFLPETGGALAQLQFEAVGEPVETALGLSDILVRAADGNPTPVAASAPFALNIQAAEP